MPLDGDSIVPEPVIDSTMAITIHAEPARVWPWLVQMGCDRGGWYGIDLLDNGGRPSATSIHPEWQDLAVGDTVAMTPGGHERFTVRAIEPGRTLTLAWSGRVAGVSMETSWDIALRPTGSSGTRLIARARASGSPSLPLRVGGLLVGEPGHVIVQRRQLVRIRRLAEST